MKLPLLGPPQPLTSLVGRESAVAQVVAALDQSRLVTLTGFGGMGKSRLALAVLETVRGRFPDGEYWVDLAALPPGAAVEETVFSAVGGKTQTNAPARDLLVQHLTGNHVLLVLDNCEHVAAQVVDLLTPLLVAAPGLHVLATSRESLGRAGERVVPVPPLRVPEQAIGVDAFAAAQYDGVRLFVDRASAVRHDFQLTDENAEAVAELCARLEGSPLAIELAASRLRSLGIAEIHERLDDRLAFLRRQDPSVPARQSSLRALIQASWDLCSPEERLVWQRASVFAGGFHLGAAEAVCGGRGVDAASVLDVIDQLVAKSVLTVEAVGDRSRYRALETIRQFGAEQLIDEDRQATLRAHRDYYLRLAQWSLDRWTSAEQSSAMIRIGRESINLTRALEWSFETPGEEPTGAEMVNALRFHWAVCGHLREGRGWLERATTLTLDPAQRITTLWVAAWVTLVQGEPETAARYLDRADVELADAHSEDLESPAAYVSLMRGTEMLFTSRLHEAIELLGASVAQLEQLEDWGGFLLGAMELVIALSAAERSKEALDVASRALAVSETSGEVWGRSQALWATGFDRWMSGDLAQAEALVLKALDLRLEYNLVGTALDLELLAWIATSAGDHERAARLLGAARAMWDGLGTRIGAFGDHFQRHSHNCAAALRRALPPRRVKDLMREGASRGLSDIIRARPQSREGLDPGVKLTRREEEVAQLIAEGMSNRDIADSLVLSPRTIDGHVENLLAKLHMRSRTQIAAWMLRNRSTSEDAARTP